MLVVLSLGAVFTAASGVYWLMVNAQQDKLPSKPTDTLNIQNKENWEELETLAEFGIIGGAIFTVVMLLFVALMYRRRIKRRQDRSITVA